MALSKNRRREISDLADAVRRVAGEGDTVLDVDRIVEVLGGRIVEVGAPDAHQMIGDASIQKVGDKFEIRVTEVSAARRRFNIAHELGHLFLHMGFLVDDVRWAACSDFDVMNRDGASTSEEYEANEFAGALLMPEQAFLRIASVNRQGTTFDTQEIADAFGVSVPAARTRGRWLGIFSWN